MTQVIFIFSLILGSALWAQDDAWRDYMPPQYRGIPEYEDYYRKHYEEWRKNNPSSAAPNSLNQEVPLELEDEAKENTQDQDFEKDEFNIDKIENEPKQSNKSLVQTLAPKDPKEKKWSLHAVVGSHLSDFNLSGSANLDLALGGQREESLSAGSRKGLGFVGGLGVERKLGDQLAARANLQFSRFFNKSNNLYFSNVSEQIDFKYLSLQLGPLMHFYPLENKTLSFYVGGFFTLHYLLSATEVIVTTSNDLDEGDFNKLLYSGQLSLGTRIDTRNGIEGLTVEGFLEMLLKNPYGAGYISRLEKKIARDDADVDSASISGFNAKLKAFGLRVGYFYNF